MKDRQLRCNWCGDGVEVYRQMNFVTDSWGYGEEGIVGLGGGGSHR